MIEYLDDQIGYVEFLECSGNDLTVVNAARVSLAKESLALTEADAGLIRYLAKNNHVTPFFHPQIRFRFKMPIFVAREWFRSTVGFARNEMSRRYVSTRPELYVPQVIRAAALGVKQGSSETETANDHDLIKQTGETCLDVYDSLIEEGVCAEQARMILPQSMYTEFIETGSLAAYARICHLRLDPSAQLEIRVYAQIVSDLLGPLFPLSWPALTKPAGRKPSTNTPNASQKPGTPTQDGGTSCPSFLVECAQTPETVYGLSLSDAQYC